MVATTTTAATNALPTATRLPLLRWATRAILAVHLALLLAALPNYRVTVDAAYHVALARQYAEHGSFYWDTIHYAPAHRPNLFGPAVHVAMGLLGRLLGGTGDDYVLANALLGIALWLASNLTVLCLARRGGGDLAGLLAVGVFSGCVYAACMLAANTPAGWMFVGATWSVFHMFHGRLWAATACAALACYAHLGGFATVPVGLLAAAMLGGECAEPLAPRLRRLALVLAGTAATTAPYWVHVVRYRDWYVGLKGGTAWWVDPLAAMLWLVGLAAALRAPRKNGLLLAWAAAPLAWVVQDASRFILLSAQPGTALGGVAIARWLARFRSTTAQRLTTAVLLGMASFYPFGVSALDSEVFWLLRPFPVMLDWNEMRADAKVIERAGLEDRIIQGYTVYVIGALAVWADIRGERGHWVEVQPTIDPVESLGVADKVYVLALPPNDPALGSAAGHRWLRIHGGGAWTSVVEFIERPSLREATENLHAEWAREAAWIAAHAEHNTLGYTVQLVLDPGELPRRRVARGESRARFGRMQIAALLYAYALEPIDTTRAARYRDHARALGWMAALVGDEMNMDFRSAAVHDQMLRDMGVLAGDAAAGRPVDSAFEKVMFDFVTAERGGFFSTSTHAKRRDER